MREGLRGGRKPPHQLKKIIIFLYVPVKKKKKEKEKKRAFAYLFNVDGILRDPPSGANMSPRVIQKQRQAWGYRKPERVSVLCPRLQ